MTETLETWREAYGTGTLVVTGAFVLGIIFGIIAEISRYCTRAAIAEWVSPAPGTGISRSLQVFAAAAFAIAGTQLLAFFGLIDLSQSIYWATTIKPVALIIGGLLFGVGMVLSGGCVSRLLVLAASGNGRSWITLLVTAIAAYATLRGLLSAPRLWLEGVLDSQTTAANLFASGQSAVAVAGALVLALLVAVLVLARSNFANAAPALINGSLIGLIVIGGWVVTGIIGADDFEPTQLASLSFVAPVGETIQYLMIFTGDTIRFSIALVLGVLSGAFMSAAANRRLRFQGFRSEASLLRYIAGGIMMGFGGVTALGCTIGQGLSGASTASPASLLAIASIIAGGYGMMRIQNARQQTVQSASATLEAK